jgi:hypothetical protein
MSDSNNFHTYKYVYVNLSKHPKQFFSLIVTLHESLYPNRKYQSLAVNTEVKTQPLSRLCMKQRYIM